VVGEEVLELEELDFRGLVVLGVELDVRRVEVFVGEDGRVVDDGLDQRDSVDVVLLGEEDADVFGGLESGVVVEQVAGHFLRLDVLVFGR